MQKALHIENLNVAYGQTPALSGVCLDVLEGEFLGVMGPNGGGKSTLIKAVLGLVPITSGKVEIFGQPLGRAHARIGYVPQSSEVDRRFPVTVLEAVLAARLPAGLHPLHRFSKADRREAAQKLSLLGLAAFESRQTGELSGGEFQRLLIARALAARPKLLLLDEPTASVDSASRELIYELLEKLSREMTVVMVTHDLAAVSARVRTLACLNQTLVYHGKPELSEEAVTKMYGCPVDLIAHGVAHRVLGEHGEGKTC